MRAKLYSYSEASARFPFLLDEKESALYLSKGERGIQFVIPLSLGVRAIGKEYLLTEEFNDLIKKGEGVIIDIQIGVVDIIVKDLVEDSNTVELQKIRDGKTIAFYNKNEYPIKLTIKPYAASKIYLTKIS